MSDYLAIDIDDDPVEPSTLERFVLWLAGLRRMPEVFFAFYDRWLERRCRSCGERGVLGRRTALAVAGSFASAGVGRHGRFRGVAPT